jgi:hypothetical protein
MTLHDMVALIWLMVAALHPGARETGQAATVVNAVARVVAQDPLPSGWGPDDASATLVSLAWHESRLGANMIGPAKCDSHGDCHAYGIWQAEHRPDLAKDPVAAARYAYSLIRDGVRTCPWSPLAPHAGGCFLPGTKKPNLAAQSMGLVRMQTAYRILHEAESQKEPDE